jgi:acetyl esterase/lipase
MKRVLLALALLGATVSAQSQQKPVRNTQDRLPPRFQQDDKDNDGTVSREEFSGPPRLFERLDDNNDGKIEPAEIMRRRLHRNPQQPTFTPPDDLLYQPDVVYGKGGDVDLKLDLLTPKTRTSSPRPLLVFVHGGAFRAGDKRTGLNRLVPFARDGYVCASINYRLSQQAIFPAQIQDCKCAIRYFRAHADRYGIDPNRIGVWGSSAGGHLVAMLGTAGDVESLEGNGGWQDQSSRVQAVCDWYGPANLISITQQESRMDHAGPDAPEAQLIGGPIHENPDKALKASPITYVTPDDPPFLIMHGTKDPTVPFEQSRELADALQKAGVKVTFVPLKEAGHGGPQFRSDDVNARVATFFDAILKPDK